MRFKRYSRESHHYSHSEVTLPLQYVAISDMDRAKQVLPEFAVTTV